MLMVRSCLLGSVLLILALACGDPQPPAPAPTAVPVTVPTATPTPTPTPLPPAARHLREKQYMLELVNQARTKAGVPALVLGDNPAAQIHAEAMWSQCYTSHWDTDGLTPYMRYSLAGGYHQNRENVLGPSYCYGDRAERANIRHRIGEIVSGWLGSPGHRDTMLDPEYSRVNIGLAWDNYAHAAVQHFESDYVRFDQLPSIEAGVLKFSGTVHGGADFAAATDLWSEVVYDRVPKTLTQGQLARVYSATQGQLIALLRPPPPDGQEWAAPHFDATASRPCLSPYDVSPYLPAPRSQAEGMQLHQEARDTCLRVRQQESEPFQVQWVTAEEWSAEGANFRVVADLSPVMANFGPGVYTLILWDTRLDGTDLQVAEYSLFHGIPLP